MRMADVICLQDINIGMNKSWSVYVISVLEVDNGLIEIQIKSDGEMAKAYF